MALVTTTGTLIRQYNAFTGLSAVQRSQSGIARAEVVYYNVNDSWPSPGLGNERLYQTGNITLPPDFGYVLTDAYLVVKDPGSSRVSAEATAQLRIYPGGILGPQINTTLQSDGGRMNNNGAGTGVGDIDAAAYNTIYPSISGSDGEVSYYLTSKPTALIYGFNSQSYTTGSGDSVFNLAVGEQNQNEPDYQITLYVRFLQYDIDQSYNYVLQSPQLTR